MNPGVKFGDLVEAACQEALKELMEKHRYWFQRLYDSRAAGNILPETAADFVGVSPGGYGFLLEAKGSTVNGSFRECFRKMVKPHQALHSYLVGRAGGDGFFVFVSEPTQVVELWDGGMVRQAMVTPRGKLPDEAMISNTFINSMGDMAKGVKALLLDYESRRSKWKARG